GIGAYRTISPQVEYVLVPLFTLNAGENVERTVPTFEQNKTILRLITSLDLSINFPTLAKTFGLNTLTFGVSDKLTYLPLENKKLFNYVSTSFDFGLTKNAYVTVAYSQGRQAPTYINSPDFSVKLGLMFGKGNLLAPSGL